MRSLEHELHALRVTMSNLIEPIKVVQEQQAQELAGLSTTVQAVIDVGNHSEIVNLVNNSHPEWSSAAYTTLNVLPADAGDDNLVAHNWFRQEPADTELTPLTSTALKAPKTIEPAEHSTYVANEGADDNIPIFDKINGVIKIGGDTDRWDLYTPLGNDLIYPGIIVYFQFEAMLANGTAPNTQFYAGIWDNTNLQRKYIEGGTFTITGSIFGTPGSTSVDYQVVAFTDSGEQAISQILTFTDAPATFTGNNHPRISFSGVPGFIKFEIYRKIGTTYVLQYTVGNTIEGSYYDIGNPPQAVVSGFPTITTTKPRAYAVTNTFQPGTLTGLGWVRHELTIFVPTTYNRSVTETGMQYLRMGLTDLIGPRQILIRRIGLSMGSGKWARSADDIRPGAHSTPSSTATGAGGSNPGGTPPPGGGGPCVLLDTPLELRDGPKQLKDVEKGDYTRNGSPVCGRVTSVKKAQTSRIYWVETESGLARGCTFDHPYITHDRDYNGTPCEKLKQRFDKGEVVTTMTVNSPTDRIVKMEEQFGDFWVGIPVVDGPHIIILGGFYDHNLKFPI